MKSKTELFKFLARTFNKNFVRIGNHGISDETYGKDSRIYLWNVNERWGITRNELESKLKDEGFKVHSNYGRAISPEVKDYDTVEVSVSYFKGWHWDE